MKHRSRGKGILGRLPRGLRVALAVVAGLAALLAALAFYDYIRINLWIDRDAGRLENYPVLLIENQKEAAPAPAPAADSIDRLLIRELCGGRNVVTLSRSEIKYNLLGTRSYVKVFLETAVPNQPDHRSPLRLICELKRGGRGWIFAGPPVEKTIK